MSSYLTAKGAVTYTIEGTPTIVNGVASGFSDSNYLKLSSSFSEQGDIDIVVKITTDNDLTAGQYPLSWEARPISSLRNNGLYIVSGGKYGCLLKDIEDNSYQSTAPSAYALSANTTYYLRLLFTAADKSLKMGASTDGENYTYGINRTLSANLCPMNTNNIRIGRAISNDFSFLGSIDLNETYIKVNGKPFFGVCPIEVKKHQIMGPVGYTKVGNPTIADGVASGFSDNDYLNIADTPFSNSNIVEMRIKFTPTEIVTGYVLGVRINNQYLGIYLSAVNNTLRYGMIMTSGVVGIPQVQVGIDYAISTLNVPYYLHYYFNPTTLEYKLGLSTDGLNPTYGLTGTATGVPPINQLQFGVNLSYSNFYFRGSVDLNETYIKVNGKLWYYQPAPTKYIIKDDKLIWSDPKIYIDDSGTKTYSSTNIACVPSGFTYGTTTTSAIGFVDIATQAFTAAPSGSTIGRDE